MTPKKIPEQIDADRLILRRIRMDDAEPFYAFVSNYESAKYMFFEDEQRTKEDARGMVEWVANAYDTDEPTCILAIADKKTGDYMGNLGAQTMEGTTDTEFFYALLPQYRGKGYVTEAVKTFLTFLFDEGIQMAVAIIVPENEASLRVMARLQARLIGDYEIHGQRGLRYEINRETCQQWG